MRAIPPPIVTVWSSGPGHWALRSTIGHAAKLTVREDQYHGPRFVKWVPFVPGTATSELFQHPRYPTTPSK
jgi:hypothetical protein